MAGKRSRKSRKEKHKLDVEIFAYDALSSVLQKYGLPEDKLRYEKRKENAYGDDGTYMSLTSALITSMGLVYRDTWKTMFESRLKSSGFGTIRKIEDCLLAILAVNPRYRGFVPKIKVIVSLAAYAEIMLFLDHQSIEFDFQQMFGLWTSFFNDCLARRPNVDKLLRNLFNYPPKPLEYINQILDFVKHVGSPYGNRDDVSELFIAYHEKVTAEEDDEADILVADFVTNFLAKSARDASVEQPVLPPGFETTTVLPGDRESPEPPCFIDDKTQAHSTGVSGSRQTRKTTSELETKVKLGKMRLGGRKNLQNIREEKSKRRISKKKDVAEESPSALQQVGLDSPLFPGKHELSTLPLSSESAAVGGKKKSMERHAGSKDFSGEKNESTLNLKQESIGQTSLNSGQSHCENLDEESKRIQFRDRKQSRGSASIGQSAMPTVSFERGAVGGRETFSREWTGTTSSFELKYREMRERKKSSARRRKLSNKNIKPLSALLNHFSSPISSAVNRDSTDLLDAVPRNGISGPTAALDSRLVVNKRRETFSELEIKDKLEQMRLGSK